jgi:hypothetical protein
MSGEESVRAAGGPTVLVNFRLDLELKERVDSYCRIRGMTVSRLLRWLVEAQLDAAATAAAVVVPLADSRAVQDKIAADRARSGRFPSKKAKKRR